MAESCETPDAIEHSCTTVDVEYPRSTKRPLSTSCAGNKKLRQKREDEELNLMRSLAESIRPASTSVNDDLSSFCESICVRLRGMDKKTRLIVRHQIENSRFSAEMGVLEGPPMAQPMSQPRSQPMSQQSLTAPCMFIQMLNDF